MRFDLEKKRAIIQYLLEKIESGEPSVNRCVSQTIGLSPNTVNNYILELQEQGVIRKVKRGKYELVKTQHRFHLQRSKGDLDSDTYAYNHFLKPLVESYATNVVNIWAYAFSEMVNNVMDHSGAENLFIHVEQDYLHTKVILLDDGIGIFRKIKEHFQLESLEEAICELFKGKLTTDIAKHSGEGIFFSSRMMDSFFILSDQKIFTNNKYDYGVIFDAPESAVSGTCVMMSLSNFSNKKSADIFNLYADVDGGFTRTRIPLKNIFETAPVSRSQAKRLCHRLDGFEEVILDFEGLDWMGQGFAHQIFVLFQLEHPDVKLICEHMSEDVEKMYRHVRYSLADSL